MPPADDTSVSLREFLEEKIACAAEKATAQHESVLREIALAQEAAKTATAVAGQVRDTKDASMNEWRKTVTDLTAQFPTRDKMEAVEKGLDARLKSLETGKSGLDGRMIGITAAIAAFFTVVQIALHFWPTTGAKP